jgi:hypothetical protein
MPRLNKEKQRAFNFVLDGENLFITGKAGTGKTFLLDAIRERFLGKKVMAVLAPTGIAAENAKGFTMHSFLRLPTNPYLPEHKTNPGLYKLDGTTNESIIKQLDILIIDEISMVRCDMLDATDMILRHYRKSRKPFGGIQIIMFGDLYQLCPVVKTEDWETLNTYYQTPYFFSCYALKKLKYRVIELEKIYRQKDDEFINMLNNVRTGDVELKDISTLDSRVDPDYMPTAYDNVVTLMTHRWMTEEWNDNMYNLLKTPQKYYEGVYSKGWYGERPPVKKDLFLKVDARVMFVRNDNEHDPALYKNGTMGRVTKLYGDSVEVLKDDGKSVIVKPATWYQYDYYVDEKTKTIYTEERARYTQIPLKLAWAVSIHKSQGLTFDEVAIDASKSFTFGQVYVALSRCTTLEGIHLISQIPIQKIIADPIVKKYLECIDYEGIVKLPRKFEPIKYEKKPLVISVSQRKFWKIFDGEIKNYPRSIDAEIASQLYKWENGKLVVEDPFKEINRVWKYTDSFEGHCPFIQRYYKQIRFECSKENMYFICDIDGRIEIVMNTNNSWSLRIRIGKVRK